MANVPNGPFSVASPMMGGMVQAEIVNINSADNSVQIRLHGYQDDQGNIPDSGLEWVKCLGQHSGLQGATMTHPYYVGAKVMVSMSGTEKFIVGSVTGYDSDKTKDKTGADMSDNTDPNTTRQTRGPKGPYNRSIPAGQGTDQTSKGTRNVTKTDDQYDTEKPQQIFPYGKQSAPFDKGPQSKFPDLKSIAVPLLQQGSNVLDTIDGMDNNVSGAIKASTKIIRNVENGGYGSAMSLLNGGGGSGGGAADQGTAQVASYFGNIAIDALLSALLLLLQAFALVNSSNVNTNAGDLEIVPNSLQYQIFAVDQGVQTNVQDDVNSIATASTNAVKLVSIAAMKADFMVGFNQAITNAVAYITSVVGTAGTSTVLLGSGAVQTLTQLIGSLQSGASSAGLPSSSVSSIGGGQLGQIAQLGTKAIQAIMGGAQVPAAVTQMIQNMNTFSGDINAMSEIMGGPASISESLTNITMKFNMKKPNLDGRGFTK